MFDKALCVRQLRYSGMMETARIRRAGYPIRHTYKEFVERYKYLIPGIGPVKKLDHVVAAEKICKHVLHDAPDYQFGQTKIFLKDFQDILLEEERSRIFLKHIIVLQRGFRRVIFQRWIRKIRNAAVTIQKNWRARGYRQSFLIMRAGFYRLQACIKSRNLADDFGKTKKLITTIQAHCRGYLIRNKVKARIAEKSKRIQELMMLRTQEENDFKKSGNSNWEDDAKINFMARFAELSKELDLQEPPPEPPKKVHRIDIDEDNRVVDDVFGFLQYSPELDKDNNLNGVSNINNMIDFFEEESKLEKHIPRKLLSRPVQFYQYSSRL